MITVPDVARVCYEANRAYCLSIGDNSFSSWDDAPDWQKETNIAGVWFHIENPDAVPSASHESWLAVKIREGWVYGKVKDPQAKTHPCIMEFERLPKDQQIKDILFSAVVNALT